MYRFARALLALTALLVSTAAQAETRTICTYDPAGKSGEYFKLLDDYALAAKGWGCLLYTSPSPRDKRQSRMPSSA